MLGDKKKGTGETGRSSGVNEEKPVKIKWSYNYFSLEPEETFKDWRESLPMSKKDDLLDDE